ncbi:hypothetical protein Hypma_016264 [Hypsizygus marmoreus]|uniref:Uncharacterized protein n=1 Tax=Hypsizygus marmoreus TaxID=39966 RepID=A0A369J203_HYPMA|nr:hypothetical protein Hypma_016264 [Hypsizygus marmoreus]
MVSSSKVSGSAANPLKEPPRAQGRLLVPQSALDHISKISHSVKVLFERNMNGAAFHVLADIDVDDLLQRPDPKFTPTILVIVSKKLPISLQNGLRRLCKPFALYICVIPTAVEELVERATLGEEEKIIATALDSNSENEEPEGSGGVAAVGVRYTSNIHINPQGHLPQNLKIEQATKITWNRKKPNNINVSIGDFKAPETPGPYHLETAKFSLFPGAENAGLNEVIRVPSGWSDRPFQLCLEKHGGQSWTFPVISDDRQNGGFRVTNQRTHDADGNLMMSGPSMTFEYGGPAPTKATTRTLCVWRMALYIKNFPAAPCHGYLRFVQIVDQDLPRWLAADGVTKNHGDLATVLMDGILFDLDAPIGQLHCADSSFSGPSVEVQEEEVQLKSKSGTCIEIPRALSGMVPKKQGILQKIGLIISNANVIC